MNYLWINQLSRVVEDNGEWGEVLSEDQVLVGYEGSLFRKSDLDEGRLARVYDSDLGIVIKKQGIRMCGPAPMVFVVFGKLDRSDSWVPQRSVEIL